MASSVPAPERAGGDAMVAGADTSGVELEGENGKGKGRVAEFVGSELIGADARWLCDCGGNTVWRG